MSLKDKKTITICGTCTQGDEWQLLSL